MATRKVLTGEAVRISAPTWNSFIDAANAKTVQTGGGPRRDTTDHVVIRCKNDDSATTIGRNEPVAVSGLLFNPTQFLDSFLSTPGFLVTAVSPTSAGVLGIALEPIPPHQIGRAAFGGVVPCEVDIISEEDDIAVAHAGSTTVLKGQKQGAVGFRILGRAVAATLGTQWCLVQLGEYRSKFASFYLGALTDELTTTTTTITVDTLTALNGEALSDTSVSVNNRFAWAAADDATCLIAWNDTGGQWELIQVLC